MKKKTLSKLIKQAILDANNEKYSDSPVKSVAEGNTNDSLFSECTEESKLKIRNLLTRLFQYRDELEYSFNERILTIHSPYDAPSMAKKSTKSKFSNNSYFNIEIIKEVGFITNCNEQRVLMKDPGLYDEMKEKFKEISNEINQK